MLIHLMQHGTCMPKELDANQPLSPMGREQITKTAKAAQILGLRFELIVASRKIRSIQTAEIMAEHTAYPVSKIEISDTVKAMARPEDTIELIKEYQGLDSMLIAGHLPSLGKVSSTLLTGNQYLDINIENGGLMQINVPLPKTKGALNWYLSPTQLAQIAKS